MAHTGITQFRRIAKLCHDKGLLVAPHATVGTGIFLAASLQVASTLKNLWKHEWQHSVFDRNLTMLDTDMSCTNGEYHVPTGIGIGVKPNSQFWELAQIIL
jgi:galactonate dehydratase